ncbi:long-chain-fatty-acid--CoA ligase [Portibacter lacus]|uniref:Long-chain-fatty-acid--CoA ligase n=1 Tax=Portibacter lacus TaxID=1099794 RepID=A0AA37SMY4_9BACT|nr:long-chain fatty acid--CoA ligase [Portibacter lacus]GLR17326.1 long-chain-fatty-acid--CoA ligase [Portibacter lacus]
MLNLSNILEDSARRYPSKDAFIFLDTHISFAQLNGAANQIANGLKAKGIKPGDKIALSCLNVPYFPMIYFGIMKAGAVVVPLSVLLKRDEVAYHLSDSDSKAYFCFLGAPGLPMLEEGYAGFQHASQCEHLFVITAKPGDPSPIEGLSTLGSLMKDQSPAFPTVSTSAEDTAVIIYTSGTTGKPKGAELTHSNLFLNAMISTGISDIALEDVQLIVLPLFHIFAMTCLMNAGVYKGATSVLLPRFDAEAVLDLMNKHKVSVFAGVPTMYWGLLNYENTKFDLGEISKNLRSCVSGGASLPIAVLEGFEEKFNVEIFEGYGMSEGSPVVTFNQKETGRKPGSVGTPVWGVEVKLVDADGKEVPVGEKGELIYKGHNVTKGYYKKPEANKVSLKDGWLYSGDVAVKDEDGFYYIVDRTKDMIIRGGLNVYPREVEEVIIKHDAVSLVAVIGVPDDQYGEEIKAFVVLNEGKNVTEDELRTYTKEHIAAYKYPRVIEFLDALPMSATGKILKKELRKS